MTGENKQKTKASMLQELESIKALLLEEDTIPVLQPEDDIPTLSPHDDIPTLHFDEDIPVLNDPLALSPAERAKLNQGDFFTPPHKVPLAAPLAKGAGENPFLPQHIRARLHGNNPIPAFELEAAQKISQASKSLRDLNSSPQAPLNRQDLINSLIEKILPELQRELHNKLEHLTLEQLEQLLK